MLVQPPFSIPTEYRLRVRKDFPMRCTSFDLGKYRLEILPKIDDQGTEAELHFSDPVAGGYSSPDEEAMIVLRILALAFDTTLIITGHRTNGLDIGVPRQPAPAQFIGEIATLNYKAIVANAASLPQPVAKQFIRACNAYALAISAQELDTSLSFLLLVVSIESLSSMPEVIPKNSIAIRDSADRFCNFLHQFSTELDPTNDAATAIFTTNLKTIYYTYRSAFVHSGHEVSIASALADRHQVETITHFIDGKPVNAPSLSWFFLTCRCALLGFLDRYPSKTKEPRAELFAEIAKLKNILFMKLGPADA